MKHPPPPPPEGFLGFIETIKPLLPIPMLLFSGYVLYRMFCKTWLALDAEAEAMRAEREEQWDSRPMVALILVATVLMFHEYYGTRVYFDTTVRPLLRHWAEARQSEAWPDPLGLTRYDELYGHAWWAFTRVLGYVLPVGIWRFAYPKDSILDMGLRARGFFQHIKLYALFLLIVAGAMVIVARAPDFGSYYPFYRLASRSWQDLLVWELMYFAQFFALELFFRGWLLAVLKPRMGSAAIFVMAVPYCMIHFGKPYLEVSGAILAGIALGSLAMKTKSIYQGCLLHISIALSMDLLALSHRDALPKNLWP